MLSTLQLQRVENVERNWREKVGLFSLGRQRDWVLFYLTVWCLYMTLACLCTVSTTSALTGRLLLACSRDSSWSLWSWRIWARWRHLGTCCWTCRAWRAAPRASPAPARPHRRRAVSWHPCRTGFTSSPLPAYLSDCLWILPVPMHILSISNGCRYCFTGAKRERLFIYLLHFIGFVYMSEAIIKPLSYTDITM